MLFHGGGDAIQFKTEAFGFDYQLFQFPLEQVVTFGWRRRARRDDRASPGANFEQSFGDQLGDYFVGGVGVDLKRLAQRAHRGKGIARAHLARYHGLLGGIGGLFV